jgi:DNA-binding CsgD family transcriptional regulator
MLGHGDAVASRATVEASAYHNELALPYGFDDLAGGLLERTDQRVISLAAMKGTGTRRFDDKADRVMALVAPHFARALALRDRLQVLEAGQAEPARPPSTAVAAPALGPRIEARLRSLYGLTPAEARVAVRIGRGLSPKEIAVEHGSSWHTVRAQIRHIFSKTGKRSQSALARVVTLLEVSIATEDALGNRGP